MNYKHGNKCLTERVHIIAPVPSGKPATTDPFNRGQSEIVRATVLQGSRKRSQTRRGLS